MVNDFISRTAPHYKPVYRHLKVFLARWSLAKIKTCSLIITYGEYFYIS
jgi:hypothetical protein